MTSQNMTNKTIPNILAIASAGGHWVQLRRLRPAWEGCRVTYISTSISRKDEVLREAAEKGIEQPQFFVVIEASRWEKVQLVRQLVQILRILLLVRPNVIISTGAAPGYFALRFGKWLGARTIWLDSIANAEELSLSGQKAGGCADLWLTQWEDLAGREGDKSKPRYAGKVI